MCSGRDGSRSGVWIATDRQYCPPIHGKRDSAWGSVLNTQQQILHPDTDECVGSETVLMEESLRGWKTKLLSYFPGLEVLFPFQFTASSSPQHCALHVQQSHITGTFLLFAEVSYRVLTWYYRLLQET